MEVEQEGNETERMTKDSGTYNQLVRIQIKLSWGLRSFNAPCLLVLGAFCETFKKSKESQDGFLGKDGVLTLREGLDRPWV